MPVFTNLNPYSSGQDREETLGEWDDKSGDGTYSGKSSGQDWEETLGEWDDKFGDGTYCGRSGGGGRYVGGGGRYVGGGGRYVGGVGRYIGGGIYREEEPPDQLLISPCLVPPDVASSSEQLAPEWSGFKVSVSAYSVGAHGQESCDAIPVESGISCGKRHKRVTALQLDSQGLEGSLSPHVGNLSFLRVLSLPNNSFQGTIPHELGRLSRLRHLYLHENKFSGVIPTNLSGCSNLEDLWLIQNKLAEDTPREAVDPTFLGNLINRSFSVAEIHSVGTLPVDLLGSLKSLTTFDGGPIPDAIGNLSLLSKVYLYSNELEGHIPSSLENCKQLNELDLADNRLSGNIPSQLLQLPSLTILLDLSRNSLYGSIQSEIKDLKSLSYLDLSYNNLSGNISSLGECIGLRMLNLRRNQFQGIIPSSLSSLRGLEVLDISQNNLSGKIPQFFDKWKSLEYLNLSFNDFEGEVPAVGVFANASAFSVWGNHRLCGGLVTLELPKCKETGSKKKSFPFFILGIVIAPTLLIVLCCVYLWCKKKRNSQQSQSSGSERFMKVSYSQLLKATDGFSVANLIGEGGFSSVYKGIIDSDDDKYVAIKVIHLQNRGAHKSFLAECKAWQNIRHRNLLKIITSCSSVDFQGNDFKALVYEYMPKGSVHDWLHSRSNTSKLNLLQRINILKDVATALEYLHNRCQTTIVHGDLKPSNILLDDDMVAHVGDFGLARLLGTDLNQNSSTGVKGTIGYSPPEYGLGSEMTSCGDVYSFGILLLEVMTGKKPTDDMFNDNLSLHKFAFMALPDHVIDVIDDDAIALQSTEAKAKKVEECLAATMKIGVSCSVDSPAQRMKIESVVNELQHILDVLQNI
ncbi:kinase-like domain-containing protein [Tanacetum coccineum]